MRGNVKEEKEEGRRVYSLPRYAKALRGGEQSTVHSKRRFFAALRMTQARSE